MLNGTSNEHEAMADTKYERVPATVGTVVTADDKKVAVPVSSLRQTSIVWKLFKFFLFLALACVLVTTALFGSIFYGGRHLISAMGEVIVPKITSDTPLDIPGPTHLSDEEATEIHDRLHEFKHAIHQGNAPPHDLILTEHEINGLICDKGDHGHRHGRHGHHHDRHRGEMCGKVHVTLSEQKVTAAISVPLEDKIPGGEGRYFVGHKITSIAQTGDAAFFVRSALLAGEEEGDGAFPIMDFRGTVKVTENSAVDIKAKSVELFGWVASDSFIERFLEGLNLADGMFQCPHFKKHSKDALRFIEKVDIGDGKVVISVRHQGNENGENEMEIPVDVDFGMRRILRAKNLL